MLPSSHSVAMALRAVVLATGLLTENALAEAAQRARRVAAYFMVKVLFK